MECIWSDYIRYKIKIRNFDLTKIDKILKSTSERYFDTLTRRLIAIGKHDNILIMIPHEIKGEIIYPITIHATTRQQINFRLKTGRFVYE